MWDAFDFAWGGAQSASDDDDADGSGAPRPRPVLAIEDGDVDPEGLAEEMEETGEGEGEADSESVTTTQPEQSRDIEDFDTVPAFNYPDLEDWWQTVCIMAIQHTPKKKRPQKDTRRGC